MENFPIGTKVRLRADVLKRHAQSVPAHMGYTTEQFKWREILRKLQNNNETGVITGTFNSKHRNVRFGAVLIGIDYTELEEEIDAETIG